MRVRKYWRNCEQCGQRAYCTEDSDGLMCCGKCFAHDEPSTEDKSFRAFCFQTPFGALFALAFLYVGALGFALEGQLTAARVCGWAGMALLCYCAVLSTVGLVREYRQNR